MVNVHEVKINLTCELNIRIKSIQTLLSINRYLTRLCLANNQRKAGNPGHVLWDGRHSPTACTNISDKVACHSANIILKIEDNVTMQIKHTIIFFCFMERTAHDRPTSWKPPHGMTFNVSIFCCGLSQSCHFDSPAQSSNSSGRPYISLL